MVKNKFRPFIHVNQKQKSCPLATVPAHCYILNSSARDLLQMMLQRVTEKNMTLTSDLLKHTGSEAECLPSMNETRFNTCRKKWNGMKIVITSRLLNLVKTKYF